MNELKKIANHYANIVAEVYDGKIDLDILKQAKHYLMYEKDVKYLPAIESYAFMFKHNLENYPAYGYEKEIKKELA